MGAFIPANSLVNYRSLNLLESYLLAEVLQVLRDLQLLQAKLQLEQAIIYNFYKLSFNVSVKDNRPAWVGLGTSSGLGAVKSSVSNADRNNCRRCPSHRSRVS